MAIIGVSIDYWFMRCRLSDSQKHIKKDRYGLEMNRDPVSEEGMGFFYCI